MVQKKKVLFKKTLHEVRSYDLEESEVRRKRSGLLPPEDSDMKLHPADAQKKEWRRLLQSLRRQDKAIENNLGKIELFLKNHPDKKRVSDQLLGSIIEQLEVKVKLLKLKKEGVEKHRKVCTENKIVSCM